MKRRHQYTGLVIFILGISTAILLIARSRPRELVLAAGEKGGVYKILAEGIARIVEQQNPHIQIKVLETQGSLANARLLQEGQADLAIVQNDIPHGPFLRTLVPLHEEVLHFVARRDIEIECTADLRGKRVCVGDKNSGTVLIASQLARHYSLDFNDFEAIHLPVTRAAEELLAGKLDAMLFMAGMKPAVLQKTLASGQAKFISLGEASLYGSEVEGFCLGYPFAHPYIIPIGCYGGQPSGLPGEPQIPISTLAIKSLLVSCENLPRATARSIVRAIFKARAQLIATHVSAAQITDRIDIRKLQFPLHPGAQSYYNREKPGFLETYAESMGFVLSLIIALISLGMASVQWLRQKRKDRIDAYYHQLDVLFRSMEKENQSHEDLKRIEKTLTKIQHRALKELISERVSANESFRIFQALLSDCQRLVQAKLQRIQP